MGHDGFTIVADAIALLNQRLVRLRSALEDDQKNGSGELVSDQLVSDMADTNLALGGFGNAQQGQAGASTVLVRYQINGSATPQEGLLDLNAQTILRLTGGTPVAVGAAGGQATVLGVVTGGASSSGGGLVPVLYDLVGGITGQEGLWDLSGTRVLAMPYSGTVVSVGTSPGNATNLRLFAAEVVKSPVHRFFCLPTPLTEISIQMVNCRMLRLFNQMLVPLRYAFGALGDTVNRPNHIPLPGSIASFDIDDILVNGNLIICCESVPTPIQFSATVTSGSPNISTAISQTTIQIGQLITGAGIPAQTYLSSHNFDRNSFSLCNQDGQPINATASGSAVQLTAAGAVIRLSTWS